MSSSGKAATTSISSSQRRNTFGGGARVKRTTKKKNTKTIQTTSFVPPPPPRRLRRQQSLPPSPGFCSMISKGKSLLPNLIDGKADKRNMTAKASSSSSSSSSSIKPDFEDGDDEEKIILYSQRWVQLGYLACLALISDWVCFSVAATPGTWDSIFHRSPETLIDVFLFTNVAFCFLEPQIVGKFGLRNVVMSAAALMTFGCALRSGLEFNDFIPFASFMPSYTEEVVGTILVGAAQPFFQCTPTLLSSRWFGKDERALSTSIAINANQIGIAVAFLVGGLMGQTNEGLNGYFSLITLLSGIVTIGAFIQFQEKPPTPPSLSQMQQEKERKRRCKAEEASRDVDASQNMGKDELAELNFPALCKRLLNTPGFWQPTAGFVASIAISNNVSAFIGTTLGKAGVENAFEADEFGAAFQLAIMFGSIFLGGYVDRSKKYKPVSLALIIISVFLLIPIGAGEVIPDAYVLFSLVLLGFTVGPVQPICAELAVEVSYPEDENGVVALQQVCGNLFSAILVPILAFAAHGDLLFGKLSVDYAILIVLGLVTLGYFTTFDAPLKRLEADKAASE
ncbi:unnamed protein product [Bathycoccus prasinos]